MKRADTADPLQLPPPSPGLFDAPPLRYTPKPGDLVLTPDGLAGIVTQINGDVISVAKGNRFWSSYQTSQLVPYLNDDPAGEVANFAHVIPEDLQSFAPGFRMQTCAGCHCQDIDLVEIDGRSVCPVCAAELAEGAS